MKSKMINLVDIILSYGLYYITWYYINVEDNIMRSNIASQKIRLWCNINGDLATRCCWSPNKIVYNHASWCQWLCSWQRIGYSWSNMLKLYFKYKLKYYLCKQCFTLLIILTMTVILFQIITVKVIMMIHLS